MKTDYDDFLKIAQDNLGFFSFMVWDYYKFPEFFKLKIVNDSLMCSYENYMLLHGKPNMGVLEDFNRKGELFISFKPDWFTLIQENFYDFKLVVNINEEDKINKFLCMELLVEDFASKDDYRSRKFSKEDMSLLGINRRIHQSRGLGGVGIIEDNSLIGCAFASQVVQEPPFSFAVIRDVWVNPDYRNQGIGTDLTAHLAKIIFDHQIKRIFLWVEERNVPAVHLYEKLGFTTIDIFLSTVCKFKNKS